MFKNCSGCGAEINAQNVHGLCIKCLLNKRKVEKEEKKAFKKLDKATRNVLTYLNKFILNPTDKIIADQCYCWSANKETVKANLHLLKYGKGELNYYHGEWTGRAWLK